MKNNTLEFKTGDAPKISDRLAGDLTLSGASVTFSMKPVVARGEITVDNKSADIGSYLPEEDVTEVSYQLSESNTSEEGDYLGEFEATYDDGSVVTYPRGRYYFISIEDDL